LEITEDKTIELEDRSIKLPQSNQQQENRTGKTEHSGGSMGQKQELMSLSL
jgi:hypothetical protein